MKDFIIKRTIADGITCEIKLTWEEVVEIQHNFNYNWYYEQIADYCKATDEQYAEMAEQAVTLWENADVERMYDAVYVVLDKAVEDGIITEHDA